MVITYWGFLEAAIGIVSVVATGVVSLLGNPLWGGLTIGVIVGIAVLRLVF